MEPLGEVPKSRSNPWGWGAWNSHSTKLDVENLFHMIDCHLEKFSTWHNVMWKQTLHMRNVKKIWHVEK